MEHVPGTTKKDRDFLEKLGQAEIKTTKQFLQHTKVQSLFPEKRTQLISVDSTDTVGHAFKLIVQHKILSLPVFEEKIRSFNAFIDVLDIVTHLVKHLDREKLKTWTSADQIEQQLESAEVFTKFTIGKVAASSGRNPYYAIDENSPLLVAMELIARNKLHRIPVVDKQGELITIVSQSHVIKLIHDNIARFSIAKNTVRDLKLGLKPVVSVIDTAQTVDAFVKINDQKISGVAVVNTEGKLVGNISASDLKHIGYETYFIGALLEPVSAFVQKASGGHPPLTVTLDSNVTEVITKLQQAGTHRIFVIDENGSPIGVISLVDVIDSIVRSVKG